MIIGNPGESYVLIFPEVGNAFRAGIVIQTPLRWETGANSCFSMTHNTSAVVSGNRLIRCERVC